MYKQNQQSTNKKKTTMTTNEQHSPIDKSNSKTAIQGNIVLNEQTMNSNDKNKQLIQSPIRMIQQVLFQIVEEISTIKSYPTTYIVQEKSTKQPPIREQTFISQYQRNLRATASKHHQPYPSSTSQVIKKSFPFSIDTSSFIDTTHTSRVYRCQLSDNSDQQKILENLVMAKNELEQVKNSDGNVTDQTLDGVYYEELRKLIENRQCVGAEGMVSHLTSQLKCKMINVADMSVGEVKFLHEYIKRLMFFYQHRDNVHPQGLFTSQRQKQEKQRLKLFFFKIFNSKSFVDESWNLILVFLENNELLNGQRKQTQITENNPTGQKIDAEVVISTIINQIKNQNWQIRQIAVDTIEKVIQNDINAMNITHLQALRNILTSANKISKKFAFRLLKRWLIKLLQIEKSLLQINMINEKNLQQTENSIRLIQKQVNNEQENKYKKELLKREKQGYQKKKEQNEFLLKENQKKQYILCSMLYNEQSRIKRKYPTYKLSQYITNMKHFQPNHLQYQEMKWFTQFYQPVLSALKPYPQSHQPIKPHHLMKIFSKISISDIRFACSQNLQLNCKLEVIKKQYERHKGEEVLPFMQQEIQCIVSEYHHGKTLREVILRNWKGLQDYHILMKLVTKLFWTIAQLQYFQFDLHIPTLQNVIVYDNTQHPELNVNLASFINTAFLFQEGKEEDKQSIKKGKTPFQELLPFVWTDQITGRSSKEDKKTNPVIHLDPIKHFLSIFLFMVCRRIDHFEGFSTMSKKLQGIIDEKTKYYMQLKQRLKKLQNPKDTQYKQLSQQIEKLQPLYDETNKQCLKNILNLIDSNESKDQQKIKLNEYFLQLTPFLPQLYSIFLKKYNLPANDIKQYQMRNYKNSNPYRIGELENYLGLKNSQLYDIFCQSLAKCNNEVKESVTWRRVFCLLFTKGEQQRVIESRLLSNLCRIFDYPLRKQQADQSWLPPQIYFALKFNIDFCYFQQLYSHQWYNCFQISPKEGNSLIYDMQTMCLLKNIRSAIVKVANQKVEQMVRLIQSSHKIYIATESYLNNLSREKEEIGLKVKAVVDMFRYLKEYEKRVYSVDEEGKQRKFGYYTQEYFDTFLEEDIDQLEQTLTLFESSLNVSA